MTEQEAEGWAVRLEQVWRPVSAAKIYGWDRRKIRFHFEYRFHEELTLSFWIFKDTPPYVYVALAGEFFVLECFRAVELILEEDATEEETNEALLLADKWMLFSAALVGSPVAPSKRVLTRSGVDAGV